LDNVTHTLFGATLARAAFPRAGRGTTAALLLASNAPDTDIVMTAGGALNYLTWHRGPTHGPLGVIGLGAATAALVWIGQRWLDRGRQADHAGFPTLFFASAVGLVAHVLMDLPTSYGTRLLSPFDWSWYAADLMPIVDVYLLAVLGAGLFIGWRAPALRRRSATMVLAFMAVNYGVRAVAHQRAVGVAPQLLAPVLAPPCTDAGAGRLLDRWPADVAGRRERGTARCLVEIAAIPTFLSPFRWQVIARLSDAYELLDLNLLDEPTGGDQLWRDAARHPDHWTPAVLRAAESDVGRVFLGFSRFPATTSILNVDGSVVVTWTDLRFVGAPRRRPGASRGLFSALVTLAPDGRVVGGRLGE
jgi:inner membrane protein